MPTNSREGLKFYHKDDFNVNFYFTFLFLWFCVCFSSTISVWATYNSLFLYPSQNGTSINLNSPAALCVPSRDISCRTCFITPIGNGRFVLIVRSRHPSFWNESCHLNSITTGSTYGAHLYFETVKRLHHTNEHYTPFLSKNKHQIVNLSIADNNQHPWCSHTRCTDSQMKLYTFYTNLF